jgi:outer membrane protein assembly factor BamA
MIIQRFTSYFIFHISCLLFITFTGLSQNLVIQKINIIGNDRTKRALIERELDFKEGDTLHTEQLTEQLERNRRKVFNLHLFATVSIESKNTDNQHIDINIAVHELWYIFPYPIIYYADRNFNEWYYDHNADPRRLIYGVALRHRNFRGRAEELKVNLQFGFVNAYEFFYKIPYIDKEKKIGVTYGLSYSANKNVRYKSSQDVLFDLKNESVINNRFYTNLVFRRRSKFYDFQYLELRYSQNSITDTIARFLNPNYFGNGQTKQHYWQITYAQVHDFRDRAQYPLRGSYMGGSITRYGLFAADNVGMTELLFDYNKYQPLSNRWYGSILTEARFVMPTKQPFTLSRGLGYGTDFIRGYELYVVDGQQYGYIKTNLKYEIFNKIMNIGKYLKVKQFNTMPLSIYPNAFFDVGYVANQYATENKSLLANQWLWGTGVGLDMVSYYNSVLRIYYARNHKGETGFRFSFAREF